MRDFIEDWVPFVFWVSACVLLITGNTDRACGSYLACIAFCVLTKHERRRARGGE